jgi:hypothetical protein
MLLDLWAAVSVEPPPPTQPGAGYPLPRIRFQPIAVQVVGIQAAEAGMASALRVLHRVPDGGQIAAIAGLAGEWSIRFPPAPVFTMPTAAAMAECGLMAAVKVITRGERPKLLLKELLDLDEL